MAKRPVSSRTCSSSSEKPVGKNQTNPTPQTTTDTSLAHGLTTGPSYSARAQDTLSARAAEGRERDRRSQILPNYSSTPVPYWGVSHAVPHGDLKTQTAYVTLGRAPYPTATALGSSLAAPSLCRPVYELPQAQAPAPLFAAGNARGRAPPTARNQRMQPGVSNALDVLTRLRRRARTLHVYFGEFSFIHTTNRCSP